ncbi:MAG TPA: hypothetical protein VG538_05885 [Vicinamibacterales bacterium]|jgi:hypothetical protein|nr:hypothetical protein [Vicinamibacterales bacterium]
MTWFVLALVLAVAVSISVVIWALRSLMEPPPGPPDPPLPTDSDRGDA